MAQTNSYIGISAAVTVAKAPLIPVHLPYRRRAWVRTRVRAPDSGICESAACYRGRCPKVVKLQSKHSAVLAVKHLTEPRSQLPEFFHVIDTHLHSVPQSVHCESKTHQNNHLNYLEKCKICDKMYYLSNFNDLNKAWLLMFVYYTMSIVIMSCFHVYGYCRRINR